MSVITEEPLEVFCKKRCSWKFHKIHRKTPVPEACNFIKKETLVLVFSREFCEISKKHLFYRTRLCDCLLLVSKRQWMGLIPGLICKGFCQNIFSHVIFLLLQNYILFWKEIMGYSNYISQKPGC